MQKTHEYQGRNIRYTLRGHGPAVVLLHGFGEHARVWDGLAAGLENHYQLLLPDLPGSDQSEMIADMSMEGLARAVYDLTTGIGWKNFVLIGHSMGGYVALALAELFPQALQGLGLFHSTAYADNAEKTESRKKGMAFIKEHGPEAFLKNTSPNLFAPSTREQKPELVEQFIADMDNFSGEALVSYYESMIRRPDRSGLLPELPYPVLIVMGRHDQAVPMEDTLKLCKLPKKAYIHTLTQSGHMGMLEEPARSLSILQEFLNDC